MSYYYSDNRDGHKERQRVECPMYAEFPATEAQAAAVGTRIAQQYAADLRLKDDDELELRLYHDDEPTTPAEWEISIEIEWDPSYHATAKKLAPEKPTSHPTDKPGQTYRPFLEEEAQ